jgi:hypothetical protein
MANVTNTHRFATHSEITCVNIFLFKIKQGRFYFKTWVFELKISCLLRQAVRHCYCLSHSSSPKSRKVLSLICLSFSLLLFISIRDPLWIWGDSYSLCFYTFPFIYPYPCTIYKVTLSFFFFNFPQSQPYPCVPFSNFTSLILLLA